MCIMEKVINVISGSNEKIDSNIHIVIADILMILGPNNCGGDHNIMKELKRMDLAILLAMSDSRASKSLNRRLLRKTGQCDCEAAFPTKTDGNRISTFTASVSISSHQASIFAEDYNRVSELLLRLDSDDAYVDKLVTNFGEANSLIMKDPLEYFIFWGKPFLPWEFPRINTTMSATVSAPEPQGYEGGPYKMTQHIPGYPPYPGYPDPLPPVCIIVSLLLIRFHLPEPAILLLWDPATTALPVSSSYFVASTATATWVYWVSQRITTTASLPPTARLPSSSIEATTNGTSIVDNHHWYSRATLSASICPAAGWSSSIHLSSATTLESPSYLCSTRMELQEIQAERRGNKGHSTTISQIIPGKPNGTRELLEEPMEHDEPRCLDDVFCKWLCFLCYQFF